MSACFAVVWADTGSGIPHTVTGTGPVEAMCGTANFSSVGAGCSHTFMTPGSFPYQCNFHFGIGMTGLVNVASVVVPPSIVIGSPTNGAVFAAPANVSLAATASATGNAVTNVTFFANTNLLGAARNAPFQLISGSLGAGSYALTAVASAGGLSATSAVVNITAVTPVPVSVSSAAVTNGQFSFLQRQSRLELRDSRLIGFAELGADLDECGCRQPGAIYRYFYFKQPAFLSRGPLAEP